MARQSHKFIIILFLGVSAFTNLAAPLDFHIDGQRKSLELLEKNRVGKDIWQPAAVRIK